MHPFNFDREIDTFCVVYFLCHECYLFSKTTKFFYHPSYNWFGNALGNVFSHVGRLLFDESKNGCDPSTVELALFWRHCPVKIERYFAEVSEGLTVPIAVSWTSPNIDLRAASLRVVRQASARASNSLNSSSVSITLTRCVLLFFIGNRSNFGTS